MAGLRAITGLLRADVIGMQIASGGFRAMPMQSMMAPPMPPQQRATVPPPRKLTQLTVPTGPQPFNPQPTATPGQVMMKLIIPSSAVGSLVGKGGSNINAVRKISSARIKLHDATQGGEREVEMIGSLEAVQTAHAMVTSIAAGVMPPGMDTPAGGAAEAPKMVISGYL
jgi:predicted RNA-binding protein YlqC (UPF0109 family)